MDRLESPHEYLKHWVSVHQVNRSLSDIARECNLNSRGHLHDLLSGRRRISHGIYQKLVKGLKLNGSARAYLKLLIERQLSPDRSIQFEAKLKRLRDRAVNSPSRGTTQIAPLTRGWDVTYAALGASGIGATLDDISARIHLTIPRCRKNLNELIAHGLAVETEGGRFCALTHHHSVESQSAALKAHLKQSLREQIREIEKKFDEPKQCLYRSVAFSLDRKRFEELREILKKKIIEFTESAEEPTGDAVARINLTFDLV